MPRILTEFIPRMAASLGTGLPDLTSVADLVDAEPHLQLRIDGDIVGAQARLRVVYAGSEMSVPLRGLPAPLAFLPALAGRSRPRVVRREVGIELAAVQRLLDLGFAYEDESKALVVQGEAAIRFWIEGIASLPEEWERFIPNDLVDVRIREQSVQPRMRVASGVDWLSLDMSFEVEGVAVDEHELRSCLEHGRRLVKLADGSYAPVEAAKVGEVLERMAEIFVGTGTRKKLPLSQAGRVQDLMRLLGSESEAGSPTDSLLNKLGNLEKVELLSKPRALKAELRPYQKQGFSWLGFLHEIGTGGILADDMGLGKTLQTIALLTWLKANDTRAKRAHSVHLVVAPTSVVPNWQREIERFAPGLRTLVWQGPDRHDRKAELAEVDVVITNYALLRRDEDLWLEREFAYIILDEAQHIKNPLSTTARVAKKLRSERRLALTGTPIENRLSEIWSIFDFVSPGLLGSLTRFEENYARPIDRGDAEASERLRHAIHPFILRRTKREVAQDLPAKIEQEIVVPLTDAQSTLYRQMLKQVRDSVLSEIDEQGIGKAQIHILAALTRLRQVACDPRLTKLPGEWTHDESGKLSALREILSEAAAGGHRVLVFSQFVEMLKLIREALDQDGITYRYLDGSTQDRMSLVDDFNGNDSITTFLISLKAGGSGLNLTGADTVVHFDPWWNPAVEDQATDRAHRIGQERVVTVYRLIARGTVEEKILQLSEKKRSLISHVLTSDGGPLKGLTRADVAELFGD